MSRIAFLTTLLLIAVTSLSFAREPSRIIEGHVTKVSDGNTFLVRDLEGEKVKVSLYGIDCPETDKVNKKTGGVYRPGQPYGDEALRALMDKIDTKRVRLEVMFVDRHQRAVSIVWVDGRNVNREMVADGWAWVSRQYSDRPRISEYLEAEENARRNNLGLWQQGNPQPPWEFRRSLKR